MTMKINLLKVIIVTQIELKVQKVIKIQAVLIMKNLQSQMAVKMVFIKNRAIALLRLIHKIKILHRNHSRTSTQKNGFLKTGAENGINELNQTNQTNSSNLPDDPKSEISIPELPNIVSISNSSLPKPILTLTKTEKGLEVLWDFETETDESLIKSYELYALNRGNNTKAWKKVGDINAIKLPIKVTLSDFKAGTCYIFAVRAKSKSGELGPYSDHQKIIL